MKKIIIPLILFFFFAAAALFYLPARDKEVTKEAAIMEAVENIASAFESSDMLKLKNYLADNFSISVASWPAAQNYIDPIMKDGRGVKGIEFVSIEKSNEDSTYVNVIFDGVNNADRKTSIMLFDKENKLVFSDYLDRLFGLSRYNESKKVASFPFLVDNGSIVIPLKINGSSETLNFLFDSGADGMAVTKTTAEFLGLEITRSQNTQVVGGTMQINVSGNNTVHLTDSFAIPNQSIAIFEEMRDGFDGIIGLNIAFNYILNVNFNTMEISMYTFGNYDNPEDGEVIHVNRPGGAILLPVAINLNGDEEYTGDFVFDTGAHYSIICFSKFVQENHLLQSGFEPTGQGTTVSMGHSTPVYYGNAKKVRLTPSIKFQDVPITLQTSSTNHRGTSPAGSFGVDLIRNFNFTIDLLRKEVHLVSVYQ